MLPPVRPAIDPLAQRAAIAALQAQRAAYANYARTLDGHRTAVGAGGPDAATAAGEAAVRGHDELAEGARKLAPLLAEVAGAGDDPGREEIAREVDAMLRDARAAEAAIHNLTTQLEAWRDAYARQLTEAGLAPGGAGAAGAAGAPGAPSGAGAPEPAARGPAPGGPAPGGARPDTRTVGYGAPRGVDARRKPPTLLDLRG